MSDHRDNPGEAVHERAALVVLRYEIAKLELKRGDTLVVRPSRPLSPENANELAKAIERWHPGCNLLIADEGTTVEVIKSHAPG